MREVAKRSFDGGREKCLTVLSPSFAIAQQPPRQRGPWVAKRQRGRRGCCVAMVDNPPVSNADSPLYTKGLFVGGRLPPLRPRTHISNVGAAISRPFFVAKFTAL